MENGAQWVALNKINWCKTVKVLLMKKLARILRLHSFREHGRNGHYSWLKSVILEMERTSEPRNSTFTMMDLLVLMYLPNTCHCVLYLCLSEC